MRLRLALGVLLIGIFASCGTEHHKSKRQVYGPRGSQRNRVLVTSRPPVLTTEEPEYLDEEEEEEPPPPSPVSYVRRPTPAEPESNSEAPPYRNVPGTGIRNRPQQVLTTESAETSDQEEDVQPARRPYVPDPNNEDPDKGGYLASPEAVATPPPRPRAAGRRVPARESNGRSGSQDVAAGKAEEEVIKKALGGSAATRAPARAAVRSGPRGRGQARIRTTTTTTAEPEEEEEEPATPATAPPRKAPVRPAVRRRRPGSTTEKAEEEEKPFTPVPKRTSNPRLRVPKPKVILGGAQSEEEDDSEEEPSIARRVTQKAPPRSTPRPTPRPTPRSTTKQPEDNKQFRGRFRPKAAVKEDDDNDRYGGRRRDSKDRSRGRPRDDDEDEDYEDYEDYDEAPPRRSRNRNRGGNRGRGRNRKNRGGRGPSTTARPTTRVPPADLEKREDGRIIDYLGDPNLPRELTGFSLVDYPFYITVPEDIVFDCDDRIDGFYASVPHFCQVFHYCHAGNRYSFLCPNYTLYDQTTFTCRFANTVDCKKSSKFYNRNDALYKEEEKIVTTLLPDPERISAQQKNRAKN